MNKKCQKFTPQQIANEMLDLAGYNHDLYSKSFLENAAGDGGIFLAAVERYISVSLEEGYNKDSIKKGLEKKLFAFEIDDIHYNSCVSNANEVASKYGIKDVQWSIRLEDYLKCDELGSFDFIVGNPPYIKYSELDVNVREYIVNEFITCTDGLPDYCYPFIERSIDHLSDRGTLVYLIPNSVFKNKFAEKLRVKLLLGLEYIRDYTSIRLFKALTHSAIIKVRSDYFGSSVTYEDIVNGINKDIQKENLSGPWIFDETYINSGSHKFGDLFDVSSSIATLFNEAFLVDSYDRKSDTTIIDGIPIENEIIKKAASLKLFRSKKDQYIIFPYDFDEDGNYMRYSVDDFEARFKGCVEHLSKYKEELNNRNSDKKSSWFEYGRSQALNKMGKRKLLVSKIFTNQFMVYDLDENTIPFSGNIIIEKDDLNLDIAISVLNSSDFYKYACIVGADASGKSHQISAKNISEYRFNLEEFIV